jgi:ureidoglycolate lyase
MLIARPLTREAFAPFGQVLSVGGGPGSEANLGTATRFDFAARLANARSGARANLCVFRCDGQRLPLELKLVERHPYSSQAFIPMSLSRYLVVVCATLANGQPDVDALHAFIGTGEQGINYDVGTWHHPMVALDGEALFSMLVWEDGSAGDCEQVTLREPRPVVDVR